MITWMTLPEIQDIVTDSCDFGDMTTPEHWREMLHCKSSDTGFGHLVDSMMTYGWMPSAPLFLYRHDYGGAIINESHHRLTAGILLCLERVPVLFEDEHNYSQRHKYLRSLSPAPEISSHWNDLDPWTLPIGE